MTSRPGRAKPGPGGRAHRSPSLGCRSPCSNLNCGNLCYHLSHSFCSCDNLICSNLSCSNLICSTFSCSNLSCNTSNLSCHLSCNTTGCSNLSCHFGCNT